jgi:hypothetical protein
LINSMLGELLEKLPKTSGIFFSQINITIFSARQHKNCA